MPRRSTTSITTPRTCPCVAAASPCACAARGKLWLQTVKLAGASAAGLSSRPEWETPYTGHFDFSAIDQPAVREWLQRPKLLARIVPICETRFRRITWEFAAARRRCC
jgi:inorganic triphosphatase YgiF